MPVSSKSTNLFFWDLEPLFLNPIHVFTNTMANIIFKTLQRTPQLSRLASPSLCFSSYRHILTPSTTRFVRFNSTTRQTTGNNDSDKNQQKPQLSLRDIMPAASKVFLYAFLTYFVLHSVWWNLELENRTKQFNGMQCELSYVYLYSNQLKN